jgi:hypothetical protein
MRVDEAHASGEAGDCTRQPLVEIGARVFLLAAAAKRIDVAAQ